MLNPIEKFKVTILHLFVCLFVRLSLCPHSPDRSIVQKYRTANHTHSFINQSIIKFSDRKGLVHEWKKLPNEMANIASEGTVITHNDQIVYTGAQNSQ